MDNLIRNLSGFNLKVDKIERDRNCFFRAVASKINFFSRDISSTLIFILLVSLFITNLVFVSLDLDRKTKKFNVESHFVKRKHREGTYLVCELRSA